jgi:hypothetical protein
MLYIFLGISFVYLFASIFVWLQGRADRKQFNAMKYEQLIKDSKSNLKQ